jgi:hypothetical protein
LVGEFVSLEEIDQALELLRVTRADVGSLRPNFKPMKVTKGFSAERYTFKVYLELHKALKGLVGNE